MVESCPNCGYFIRRSDHWLGWLDSLYALDAIVERFKQVKSIGIDVGL
jgi:hypothetical protein